MVSDAVIEDNAMAEYRLGWVPEGYVESEVYTTLNTVTISYETTNNAPIIFTYSNEN